MTILLKRMALAVAMLSLPVFGADESAAERPKLEIAGEEAAPADGGDIVIGKKQKPSTANEKLTYPEAVELCRKLSPAAGYDEADQTETLKELGRFGKQGGEMILACLDPRVTADKDVRLGALKAIDKLKMSGSRVSGVRALTAVVDPVEDVRMAVAHQIKDKKDDAATGTLVQALMGSYNEEGKIINKPALDNAAAALRVDKSNKKIYQALLYYVTMEMRIGNTELVSAPTVQVNTYTMLSGANGAVLIPLALPITLPQLKHTVVKTTVCAPAINALQELTGEEFGEDVNAWMRWMRKLK